jgi:hypothetical protein
MKALDIIGGMGQCLRHCPVGEVWNGPMPQGRCI